jgi:epoxyqueuosine reductase
MTREAPAEPRVTTAEELRELADALGLDVVGAAPVAPYTDTESHILERRERGLFGSMRFTMSQPEVSCHPERLLEDARTVVSAALCYYAPGPEPGVGEGRLPRYAWRDHYALLRGRLDALGRRLGGSYRVLVDANQHVDRAGAERSGVGFIGKNTMLITRTHGSWVVLGTLVTDVVLEPTTPPVAPGCGSCTLCIDACPTDALRGDEPGVLDATRCLSYWTQTAGEMPDDVMDALDDRVYGCDICQDVCPWNTGVAARREAEPLPEDSHPAISLADWLTRDAVALGQELERLFVPRNDVRWLRRNALVALGNAEEAGDVALAEPFLDEPEPALAAAAARAVSRLAGRG